MYNLSSWFQLAVCTEQGTVIEIEDNIADTLEQAENWLMWATRINENLWSDNQGTYFKIVDMN